MQKHEIPIYKVCHLLTPNDFKDTASEQLYSPELTGAGGGAEAVPLEQQQPLPRPGFVSQNTLYVFYGDIEFEIIEEDEQRIVNINELFNSDPRHKIFRNIFSEYELSAIQETRIRVVFLPERIYPDDSIETIKKKFLTYTRTTLRLTYGELYMFCKQAKNLKSTHVNEQLTSNGKMEITPIRIQNFLLNIDNHPVEVVNYGGADLTEDEVRQFTDFTKLGEPSPESGNYNYSNILNLKLEDEPRFLNMVIGQELSSVSRDYPYAVNPFDALYMDPFLETHITEIINTTNKIVLLDIGAFLHNTIYLATASDVLKYTISLADPAVREELGIASFDNARVMTEKYVIQLYFPYLAVFRDDTRQSLSLQSMAASEGDADLTTIHSLETLNLHREKLYEADDKIMNDKFMRQTSNVKLLYDIYERRDRAKEHQYIDDGLRGVEFIIHPETKYNISLDALFKKIHCDKSIPFIKFNPGKRMDNIYKLFTSGTSKSGRKIPKMQKSDIFRLMRTSALKKGLAIYINYVYLNKLDPEHKANHLSIPVICEIHADGCILVKTFFKYSFRVDEVKDIIVATVNPVLEVMKEYIEQSGYEMKLFKNFNEENIDIINIEYFSQIAITKNIEIKTMIKCISSVFNEIEGSLKKGIILRYKRVSNYNDMTSQDAYIVEMLNKRHTDREIIDGLQENYMIEEQDARMKIARLLQSIELQQLSRYRGGTIRIKNNPGFLTKITKGQFNNIISIEISNINNIKFLQLLQMYMDSIIRIYQNPSSTAVPYYEIEKLCRGVVTKNAAAAAPRQSDQVLESGFSSGVASASDVQTSEEGGELGGFVNISQNKAVTKEVNREDKEADVGGVADITASSRKPFPESVSAAIIGENLVFGFEAEQQQAAVGEAADDYEAFFGLIDEEEEEEEEEEGAGAGAGGGGVGGAAEFSKGGAKARGRPKSKKQGSERGSDSDSGGESEAEDMSDITGMELSNPNPFSKRIQERDPDIHLNEDSGKFNAYSRSCPGHYGRQPVILTDDEKAQIDKEHPGSYSQSIRYGSDPKSQYNYICPRYWSLKHNTSLTEEEVKSGKYGKIIPHKSKKIPPGTNIFEFTDDKYHIDEQGNYKQHYPGFLKKDVHPKGLCVPCCFSQWDKPSQTQRRQECELKQHEEVKVKQTQKRKKTAGIEGEEAGAGAGAASASASAEPSSGSPPVVAGVHEEGLEEPAAESLQVQPIPNHSEVVKISEMKDDRILSSDKFPLDNNRWGYLPVQIQKFLFTDNRNCQVSLKNTAIKKDTPCLLRRGVEAHDKQSFVSVIAYYYMEQKGKTKTSIRTDSRLDAALGLGRESQLRPHNAMAGAMAESIRDIIEENATPGKINITKLMSMIEKTVAKKGTSSLLLLNQQASSGAGAVAGAAASPVSLEEAGARSASASVPASEENPNYESKNETPISMTPRAMNAAMPSSGAAIAPSGSVSRVDVLSDIVPTIRDMRNIIKESLDIDSFITLQNGTLVDVFYNSKQEIQERDTIKYKTSEIYKKLRASAEAKDTEVLFNKICNAFENFIGYLDRDDITIDHTYLWDIVTQPNPKLFDKGNNIILLHIPDDDITNNVQVICPTNSYSGEVFDPNKNTIIIMKRDKYYEPIYLFESKSNGKFDALGRFAIKSKTIMPRIKHIIETIRDLYFSYCRLHSSRPRQYKYVMNMPAKQIAKFVKDAGFQIMSQVMNYNGKIIGLHIKQTITITKFKSSQTVKTSTTRKVFSGVIPTAASAPIVRSKMDTSAASTASAGDKELYDYPIVMMDDDQIWGNNYREEVEFLNQVADHVKKMTKQTIYCRPKVKVVEDGIIIGIITETNQFVQVRIDEADPQLNQDDGIPTVTEGNQLMAEKEISTVKPGTVDKVREKYVRNVRLETNFYNVFRNTARIILNKPENKATKDEIERIINSPFMVYSNKLSRIVELLKGMIAKYVGFITYSKDVLKNIGEVSGCIYKDDTECSKKKYCMRENGGLCKLLLPERNLMYPSIDNSIAYYGKLTDEIIRYERVKLFIFEPTKYLTFQETKYELRDNEIILLESLITQEYFENLVPVDPNPFAINTHFYTINPNRDDGAMVQIYDNLYRKGYVDRYKELNDVAAKAVAAKEMPPGAAGAVTGAAAEGGVELFHISEIDHVLSFCNQVSKRKVTAKMQSMFFPKDCYELLFSNESEECSFDVILTILRTVAQNASKCPSGHTCHRLKRPIKGIRPAQTISASLEASAASEAGPASAAVEDIGDESTECRRCRLSIGAGDTGFACVNCNYFVCENCQHQHVDRMAEMNVTKIKEILVEEYEKLSRIPTFDKKLTTILNGYGMKKFANLILEGKATFAAVIQSANYFLTNVDIWILARYFKLPIVFVSQSLLIENGKHMLVLYGDASIERYFFIHPFGVTQDTISRFSLFGLKITEETSVFKIHLSAVTPELQETIAREIDADEPSTLEHFITTFKIANIKNKPKPLFVTTVASGDGKEASQDM